MDCHNDSQSVGLLLCKMNTLLRVIVPAATSINRRFVQAPFIFAKTQPTWRIVDRNVPSVWISARSYAKKTNKKKTGSTPALDVNETSDQTVMLFDEKAMNTRFSQAINALKEQFSALRIGRANPGNNKRINRTEQRDEKAALIVFVCCN